MPLSRNNGALVVATGDPYDVTLSMNPDVDRLTDSAGAGRSAQIARLIKTHFGVGGETVSAMMADRAEEVELIDGLDADDSEAAKMAQEASVVKLVNEILVEAANERRQRHPRRAGRRLVPHPLSHRRYFANPITARRDQPLSGRHPQPHQDYGGAQRR